MQPFNVMAIFCEDIREEKGDSRTLVGVFPDVLTWTKDQQADGLSLLEGAKILAKLCVYVRINFDPEFDIGEPTVRLLMPDERELSFGKMSAEIIEKARAEAKGRGAPLAGVLTNVTLVGFASPRNGVLRLEVAIQGVPYLAGAVIFREETNETPITIV